MASESTAAAGAPGRDGRDERQSLPTLFMDLMEDISEGERLYRFDLGSFFWSLSRLYGCYHRIIAVHDPEKLGPNTGDYTFLDADIENFIIRVRVVLNNLAFCLRKLYPKKVPGLTSWADSGKGRMKASFRAYLSFITEYPDYHPAMTKVLEANRQWLQTMLEHREDVLHYTGMAFVFEPSKDTRSFAILRTGVSPEHLPSKMQLFQVFEFINEHMCLMQRFIDVDLVCAVTAYADEYKLKRISRRVVGTHGRMQSPGIELYRLVNHI
jgi:hypothetical protein